MADLFDRYLKVEIKYEASLRQITMIPVEADSIGESGHISVPRSKVSYQ